MIRKSNSDDRESRKKGCLLRMALSMAGLLFGIMAVEVILQFAKPFETRLRADKIILAKNANYDFEQDQIAAVERHIHHTKNSLGFRGPEPPDSQEGVFTILFVGGSTTECFYMSDGKTWPEVSLRLLSDRFDPIWSNNAGLDGHSTLGHIALLKQHVLAMNPTVVVFLIGINDTVRDIPQSFGDEVEVVDSRSLTRNLVGKSALLSLGLNIYRYHRAKEASLVHSSFDADRIVYADEAHIDDARLEEARSRLVGYQERVQRFVSLCRESDIEPILITQPALYGSAVDDVTGADLSRWESGGVSGLERWLTLELFNNVARQVGRQEGVLTIDLAQELPKSTRYFYDAHHFTADGCRKVAEIVCSVLIPHFQDKYPGFVREQDP